ncbi:hypothetical protein QYE76_038674 [Lolium multiflorum]|uniref:AB hydrolase-1 domain-containing protein n=1 Tax=Lolium multiflorum TaxID=4521 RepID=A0AAD8T8H2_LOLMU|nr:hypothetical protein QYE76_038674 [Lolium multiflorum]
MPGGLPALLSRPAKWPRVALAAAVFTFLDVLDVLLCLVYAVLDAFLEDSPVACYCHRTHGAEEEVSDTLYLRRSAIRDALLALLRTVGVGRTTTSASPGKARSPRWSDCGCARCLAWWRSAGGGGRLHFVVVGKEEPTPSEGAATERSERGPGCDAIFIHGFTSSSSFWARTVFPELAAAAADRRLLAVDLLGFGDSPKPANCAYTLRDHVEAIERSLVDPLGLSSFHLVSHSMGCTVAIALAARNPARVRSITLVAPLIVSCSWGCIAYIPPAVLRALRREGEPGGAEPAGREEALAAVGVRHGGDVVVRAHREDCLLRRLQEPPGLGVAHQDPHAKERRGLRGQGPDEAHASLGVEHDAQRDLRRGGRAGPEPGGAGGRRRAGEGGPRRRGPGGSSRVQQPSPEIEAPTRGPASPGRTRPPDGGLRKGEGVRRGAPRVLVRL